MRRSDDLSGRGKDLAGPSPSAAGSDRSLGAVIQFPTQLPSRGPGAGVVPPTTPANFESLGSVVQAVVLRVASDRVRLHVESSVPVSVLGGEGEDRDG